MQDCFRLFFNYLCGFIFRFYTFICRSVKISHWRRSYKLYLLVIARLKCPSGTRLPFYSKRHYHHCINHASLKTSNTQYYHIPKKSAMASHFLMRGYFCPSVGILVGGDAVMLLGLHHCAVLLLGVQFFLALLLRIMLFSQICTSE